MLTKADFLKAAEQEIRSNPSKYSQLSPLLQAGDPRLTQAIGSIATMLSMLSQQIEASTDEQFNRIKKSTVDAWLASHGVWKSAKAATFKVRVKNPHPTANVHLGLFTQLVSDNGVTCRTMDRRAYNVEPNNPITVDVGQYTRRNNNNDFVHTVTETKPFYQIELPLEEDGEYREELLVYVNDEGWSHQSDYMNLQPGDKAYTLTVSSTGRLVVQFGDDALGGRMLKAGDVVRLNAFTTKGADHGIRVGTKMVTENPFDRGATLEFEVIEITYPGDNPMSEEAKAQLAKYPALYDSSAVYLGEFEAMVRRKMPNLQFLSIWNEMRHEEATGTRDVKNVNCLFVAALNANGTGYQYGHNANARSTSVQLTEVPANQMAQPASQFLYEIEKIIKEADDSYRVRFWHPCGINPAITVNIECGSSFDAEQIRTKAKQAIIKRYGRNWAGSENRSPAYANRAIRRRDIVNMIQNECPELRAPGSEIEVVVDDPAGASNHPNIYKWVREPDITINVKTSGLVGVAWGED